MPTWATMHDIDIEGEKLLPVEIDVVARDLQPTR
jgi:hypothetical protein